MAEEEKELTVGELGVEAFFALLVKVMAARKEGGDPRLMELTVPEFSTMMLESFKTRAYQTANAENIAAQQVLTDWKGIQSVDAVTQPFRIRSIEEANLFAANLSSSFNGGFKGEFAVAVAIVSPQGMYAPKPR